MGWDDLLKSLEASGNRSIAVIEMHGRNATDSLQDLQRTLRVLSWRRGTLDVQHDQIVRGQVDLATLKQKVERREWTTLTRDEVRAVPHVFLELSAGNLHKFLEWSPQGWRRYLAALLRGWAIQHSGKEWNQYAELSVHAPANAWPIAPLPIPRPVFLMREGPDRIAIESRDKSMQEFAALLRDARVQPWTQLFGACLTSMFVVREKHRRDASADARWLVDSAEFHGLALPSRKGTELSRPGNEDIQTLSVAALLGCRLQKLIGDAEFERVEHHLLDCTFGDPRVGGGSWTRVRERNEPAFQLFLEKLIRDDLRFFFAHAMRERDRAAFWLRYLKSIRRTSCILDPTTHARLEKVTAAAEPQELRAAFQRARKFLGGETSAFCLWFDRFVVVEFSDTGNAAYVYTREVFEKEVDAPGKKLWDVGVLKKSTLVTDRWIHREGWQVRIAAALLKKGVGRDSAAAW